MAAHAMQRAAAMAKPLYMSYHGICNAFTYLHAMLGHDMEHGMHIGDACCVHGRAHLDFPHGPQEPWHHCKMFEQ